MAETVTTIIVALFLVGAFTTILLGTLWLIVGVLRGIEFFSERWPHNDG